MSRRATSRTRQARHAANGPLAVRTGAPAAAVAAVSSLTLTGVAVLGFMPGASITSGLQSGAGGLRGPGVVEAIPFATPSTSNTSRPRSGFTVGSPAAATAQRASGRGQTAGNTTGGTPGRGSTSRPRATSTTSPAPAPAQPQPQPIVVAVGDLPDPLASSARAMVVDAVNRSLSYVMAPGQLRSVQDTLTPAVDLAVRTAVSSAAQDALHAATAATAANLPADEVSSVTTQTFRTNLPPALAATVPVAVSATLTTAGVVPAEAAPVVDALVAVATTTASDSVADVTTPSVVEQVTTVVTTPGATPTTPSLTPSPTTEPTSTEEPTGTPETPDADADATDESSPSADDAAAPTAAGVAAAAVPTTVPAALPAALPAAARARSVVESVTASHVLVVQLARQAPINPTAVLASSNLFRVSPHLAVRITTTPSASPTAKPRTTTTVVPTTSITSAPAGVTRPAVKHDKPGRSAHATKESRRAAKTQKASTPKRTSTPAPSRTGERSTSAPTSPVTLPDGFSSWTPRNQWRWLKQSGLQISFGQWKRAVRQQDSSVTASLMLGSSDWQTARPSVGKHRR